MTRIILPLMLILVALCALALGVIRARPYANDSLSVWLDIESDGCTLSCWRDIRPGVTPADMALLELARMDDVTEITDTPTASSLQGSASYIGWRWVTSQPDSSSGLMIVEEGVVQEIYMALRVRVGDMWLTLGAPMGGEVSFVESYGQRGSILHTMVYPTRGLTVMSYIDCPIILPRAWTQTVFVWLRDLSDRRFDYLLYDDYMQRRAMMLVMGRREYC